MVKLYLQSERRTNTNGFKQQSQLGISAKGEFTSSIIECYPKVKGGTMVAVPLDFVRKRFEAVVVAKK